MVPAEESLTEVLYGENTEYFFLGKRAYAHMEKSKIRLLFRIPTDPILWVLLTGEDSIKLLKLENVKFI